MGLAWEPVLAASHVQAAAEVQALHTLVRPGSS